MQHCKNKIVEITNLFVSTVARNRENCNLIGGVGCWHGDRHTYIYNPIIVIAIILILSITYT